MLIQNINGHIHISDEFFEINDISLTARGILIYLLSRPEGWEFNMQELLNAARDGKSTLQKGLRELELKGYLKRTKIRNKFGRFEKTVYTIYEKPNK